MDEIICEICTIEEDESSRHECGQDTDAGKSVFMEQSNKRTGEM